jgi:threonylcarbamoyladenosine tRNA methylthiotransferase MtaB
MEDVAMSAIRLSDAGYREIVLTGIHIASYGLDLKPKRSLLDIVEMLITSYPQIRIRLALWSPGI